MKPLMHPERPVDGGTFHTLEVKVPERSIFAAEEPAACEWYFRGRRVEDQRLPALPALHPCSGERYKLTW